MVRLYDKALTVKAREEPELNNLVSESLFLTQHFVATANSVGFSLCNADTCADCVSVRAFCPHALAGTV